MRSILLLFIISLGLIACREKETPGGVKFTKLKKGDGQEIASGKMIVAHMIIRNPKDTIVLNTYETELPMVAPMPDASMENDKGEYGVLKMLTKGDCVTFKLKARTLFTSRRRAVPKEIDPESLFTYIIKLSDVWTVEQAKKYEIEQTARLKRKQHLADSTLIANELKAIGAEALQTKSGLQYIVRKKGKGDLAKVGSTAYVHYAGYYLNGDIFDTSSAKVAKANNFNNGGRDQPIPVKVGIDNVISAWHEILQNMNKGMRVTVYVPSELAYGPAGMREIPSNAVLIFDMEIIELK